MNTTGNLINSPGIQILASNCLTVPQKNLNMQLTVRLDIAAISWIGWRPSYTFDRAQACPSIEQLAALVKALTSGA